MAWPLPPQSQDTIRLPSEPKEPTTLQKISKFRPVSVATALALTGVFAYEKSGKAAEVDCSNRFLPTMARDFIHQDTDHFASNMLALLLVSNVEAAVGSVEFLAAMGSILLLSALLTMGLTKMFSLDCSIGFSGVLLGLMTFGLLVADSKTLNWSAVALLVLTSIAPLFTGNRGNVSVSGHLIGIAAGGLIGLAYRLVERIRGSDAANETDANEQTEPIAMSKRRILQDY